MCQINISICHPTIHYFFAKETKLQKYKDTRTHSFDNLDLFTQCCIYLSISNYIYLEKKKKRYSSYPSFFVITNQMTLTFPFNI